MIEHRLGEPGAERRFDFEKGERVCFVKENGSPDLENSGVIVDGVWRGTDDRDGGAFAVTYTVEVEEGKVFHADHYRLMSLPIG